MVVGPSIRKTFAASLAAVYLLVNGFFAHAAESNMWAERRHVVSSRTVDEKLAALSSAADPLTILKGLPSVTASALGNLTPAAAEQLSSGTTGIHAESLRALLKALPYEYGSVRNILFPSHPSSSSPIVLHVQDVHAHLEAQKNIGSALRALLFPSKDLGARVSLVALEGASTPIGLDKYRNYPDKDAVRETADYLLKENGITGPIHTVLTSEGPLPPVVGIDDDALHEAKLEAYRKSVGSVPDVKIRLAQRARENARLKAGAFNRALMDFDQTVQLYRQEKISLGDYVTALAVAVNEVPESVRPFLDALRMEKSLDFKKVETERSALIEALVPRMDKPSMEELLSTSVAYRMGQVRHADFYQYLKTLCGKKGVSLAKFPAMDEYLRYVVLADRVDAGKLLDDLQVLEKSAYNRLAVTDEEKNLLAEARRIYLSRKLADFALIPQEWKEYKEFKVETSPIPSLERRGQIQISPNPSLRVWGETGSQTSRAGEVLVPPFARGGSGGSAFDLSSFEDFYRAAEARDRAMTANLFKALFSAGKKESGPRIAVLVTGGFHSQGMLPLLRDRGATVVQFTPKVTQVNTAAGSAYLSIFTQEKSPLETLFQGDKLFVWERPDHGVRDGMALGVLAADAAARNGVGAARSLLPGKKVEGKANERQADLTVQSNRGTFHLLLYRENGNISFFKATLIVGVGAYALRGAMDGLAQAIYFSTGLSATGILATGGLFMLQVVGSLAVLFAMVAVVWGFTKLSRRNKVALAVATFAGCIGYRTPLDPDQEVHVGDARQDSGAEIRPFDAGMIADRMPMPLDLGTTSPDQGMESPKGRNEDDGGLDVKSSNGEVQTAGGDAGPGPSPMPGTVFYQWHNHIVKLADGSMSAAPASALTYAEWKFTSIDGRTYLVTLDMLKWALRIFDVTDPNNFVLTKEIAPGVFTTAYLYETRGNFLYFVRQNADLSVSLLTYDLTTLSDPSSPLTPRTTPLPTLPRTLDALVDGETAVVGFRNGTIVSPPSTLAVLNIRTGGLVYFPGAASNVLKVKVDQAKRLAYVTTEDSTLEIWDLSKSVPERLSTTTGIPSQTTDFDLSTQNGRTFAAMPGFGSSFSMVDVTDPSHPGPVSLWNFSGAIGMNVVGVGSVDNALVIFGSVSNGSTFYAVQSIVDRSDPDNLTLTEVRYLDPLPAGVDGTVTLSKAPSSNADGGIIPGAMPMEGLSGEALNQYIEQRAPRRETTIFFMGLLVSTFGVITAMEEVFRLYDHFELVLGVGALLIFPIFFAVNEFYFVRGHRVYRNGRWQVGYYQYNGSETKWELKWADKGTDKAREVQWHLRKVGWNTHKVFFTFFLGMGALIATMPLAGDHTVLLAVLYSIASAKLGGQLLGRAQKVHREANIPAPDKIAAAMPGAGRSWIGRTLAQGGVLSYFLGLGLGAVGCGSPGNAKNPADAATDDIPSLLDGSAMVAPDTAGTSSPILDGGMDQSPAADAKPPVADVQPQGNDGREESSPDTAEVDSGNIPTPPTGMDGGTDLTPAADLKPMGPEVPPIAIDGSAGGSSDTAGTPSAGDVGGTTPSADAKTGTAPDSAPDILLGVNFIGWSSDTARSLSLNLSSPVTPPAGGSLVIVVNGVAGLKIRPQLLPAGVAPGSPAGLMTGDPLVLTGTGQQTFVVPLSQFPTLSMGVGAVIINYGQMCFSTEKLNTTNDNGLSVVSASFRPATTASLGSGRRSGKSRSGYRRGTAAVAMFFVGGLASLLSSMSDAAPLTGATHRGFIETVMQFPSNHPVAFIIGLVIVLIVIASSRRPSKERLPVETGVSGSIRRTALGGSVVLAVEVYIRPILAFAGARGSSAPSVPAGRKEIVDKLVKGLLAGRDPVTGLVPSHPGHPNFQNIEFLYDLAHNAEELWAAGRQSEAEKLLDYVDDRIRLSTEQVKARRSMYGVHGLRWFLESPFAWANGAVLQGVNNALNTQSTAPEGASILEYFATPGPMAWVGMVMLQVNPSKYRKSADLLAGWLRAMQGPDGGIYDGNRGPGNVHVEPHMDAMDFFRMMSRSGDADRAWAWFEKNALDKEKGEIVQGVWNGQPHPLHATDAYTWTIAGNAERMDAGLLGKLVDTVERKSLVKVTFIRPDGKTVTAVMSDFTDPEDPEVKKAPENELDGNHRGGYFPMGTAEWTAGMATMYQVAAIRMWDLGQKDKASEYKAKAQALLAEIQKSFYEHEGGLRATYATAPWVATGHGWRTPIFQKAGDGSASSQWVIFPLAERNPFKLGAEGDLSGRLAGIPSLPAEQGQKLLESAVKHPAFVTPKTTSFPESATYVWEPGWFLNKAGDGSGGWGAFNRGDYAAATKWAGIVVKEWGKMAAAEQKRKAAEVGGIVKYPWGTPHDDVPHLKDAIWRYPLLNEIGAAAWMLAASAFEQGKKEEAKKWIGWIVENVPFHQIAADARGAGYWNALVSWELNPGNNPRDAQMGVLYQEVLKEKGLDSAVPKEVSVSKSGKSFEKAPGREEKKEKSEEKPGPAAGKDLLAVGRRGDYSSSQWNAKAVYFDFTKPVHAEAGDVIHIEYTLNGPDGMAMGVNVRPKEESYDSEGDMTIVSSAKSKHVLDVTVGSSRDIKQIAFQIGGKAWDHNLKGSLGADIQVKAMRLVSGKDVGAAVKGKKSIAKTRVKPGLSPEQIKRRVGFTAPILENLEYPFKWTAVVSGLAIGINAVLHAYLGWGMHYSWMVSVAGVVSFILYYFWFPRSHTVKTENGRVIRWYEFNSGAWTPKEDPLTDEVGRRVYNKIQEGGFLANFLPAVAFLLLPHMSIGAAIAAFVWSIGIGIFIHSLLNAPREGNRAKARVPGVVGVLSGYLYRAPIKAARAKAWKWILSKARRELPAEKSAAAIVNVMALPADASAEDYGEAFRQVIFGAGLDEHVGGFQEVLDRTPLGSPDFKNALRGKLVEAQKEGKVARPTAGEILGAFQRAIIQQQGGEAGAVVASAVADKEAVLVLVTPATFSTLDADLAAAGKKPVVLLSDASLSVDQLRTVQQKAGGRVSVVKSEFVRPADSVLSVAGMLDLLMNAKSLISLRDSLGQGRFALVLPSGVIADWTNVDEAIRKLAAIVVVDALKAREFTLKEFERDERAAEMAADMA